MNTEKNANPDDSTPPTLKTLPITIIGAGSIGCYVGGCLIHSRHNVTLIGRPRIGDIVNEHGLYITNRQGFHTTIASQQVHFSTQIPEKIASGIVFICVKSGDTQALAEQLSSVIDKSCTVVSLQNGIHNTEYLRHQLPDHKILAGMVSFNVLNRGEGHFHCGTEGHITIEHSKSDQLLDYVFDESPITHTLAQDMPAIQWSKLLMNLNNAVNALSGEPLYRQLHNHEYRLIMSEVVGEALKILKRANIKTQRIGKVIPKLMPFILRLPNWAFTRVASAMLKIDPHARSSMYEDLEQYRRTEIDVLNGEIVKLAESLGAHAPLNEKIVNLVKAAEQAQQGSPKLSPQSLQQILYNP